jgi:hypothetical protein
MQTYCPFPCVIASARVLDDARLERQRSTAKRILDTNVRILNGDFPEDVPLAVDPVVSMWRGHEHKLAFYGRMMCAEWAHRGHHDKLGTWFWEIGVRLQHTFGTALTKEWPAWWGNEFVHSAHRSELLLEGWTDETVSIIDGPVDNWLLEHGFPRRFEIKDTAVLWSVQDALSYRPPICNTHYGCFGWPEASAISYNRPLATREGE